MLVSIIRLNRSEEKATLGILLVDGAPLCVTLELPNLKNMKSVSCVPHGEYECQLVGNRTLGNGQTLTKSYLLLNVPNRSGILFHPGNTAKDTEGCILLGQAFGDGPIILQSRTAFSRFLHATKGESKFTLHIRYLPELY